MPGSDLTPAQGIAVLVQLLMACGLSAALGITVIGAWITRELTHGEGALYSAGVLAVSVALVQSIGSALFLPLVAGAGVALWLLRAAAANRLRRKRRSMLEQDLQVYEAALKRDPRNAAAHSRLARTLERLGRVEEAVEHYHRSLELQPRMNEDKHRLDLLLREMAATVAQVRRCPRCLGQLPPRAVDCPHCQRPVGAWSAAREIFGGPVQAALCCGLLAAALLSAALIAAFQRSSVGGVLTLGIAWLALFSFIMGALLRRRK